MAATVVYLCWILSPATALYAVWTLRDERLLRSCAWMGAAFLYFLAPFILATVGII